MARPKTFTETDDTIDLFPAASHKLVTRIIERAAKKELAANKKALKTAVRGSQGAQRFGRAAERFVAKQLGQALVHRGASKNQAPSTRQKAPDTGGRPFHFAHSVVLSGRPPSGGSGPRPSATDGASPSDKSDAPSPTSGGRHTTRAAAHMRYIERPEAVETAIGRNVEIESHGVADLSIDPRGVDNLTQTSRGNQAYIENPAKLANGENVIFSFGTIGDHFDDRVAFWQKLEDHELHPGARVQDRLIVELPHEASAHARYEMIKIFCRDLEEMRLPYWAALHAPGASNDGRNFHAHIVYSTRPAQRMVDPADGETRWDFEITEAYKTSSRHTKIRHPHRQDREPSLRKVDAIGKMRRRFADVVNDLLVRDDVKDGHGAPVRYDARSYRDMGLDVVPMRSINRIVADKMKAGHLTVLDRDYTRKMIETELHQARGRRDARLSELDRLRKAIDRLSSGRGRASDIAVDLPKDLRPAPRATLTGRIVKRAGEAMLTARYAAYVHDVMEQSSRATLDRIVEATDPVIAARSRSNTRDDAKRAAMPDPVHLVWLHDEAKAQRASFEAEAKRARRRLALRVGHAANKWAEAVGTKTPMTTMERPRRARTPLSLNEAARALARAPRGPSEPVAARETASPGRKADPISNAASVAPGRDASPGQSIAPGRPTSPGQTTEPIQRRASPAEIKAFRKRLDEDQAATIKSLRALRKIPSIDDRISAVKGLIASKQTALKIATAAAISAIRDAEARQRRSTSGTGEERGVEPTTKVDSRATESGPARAANGAPTATRDVATSADAPPNTEKVKAADRGATPDSRERAGERGGDQRQFDFPTVAREEGTKGAERAAALMMAAASLPTAASIPSRRAVMASTLSDQPTVTPALEPGLAGSTGAPPPASDIGPESQRVRVPEEEEIDKPTVPSPLDPGKMRRKAILSRRRPTDRGR